MMSRAEHVKFCLKMARPFAKVKYKNITDSEKVPRGNVEKSTEKCSEKSEKLNVLKQSISTYLLHNGSAT